MRPCPALAAIPAGDVGMAAASRLWLQDRTNLRDCRRRHGKLIEAVKARDAIQGAR